MLKREAGSSTVVAIVAFLEDESTNDGARAVSVQDTGTGGASISLGYVPDTGTGGFSISLGGCSTSVKRDSLGGCSTSIASLAE